jgi:DNA-binding MarR family transcriptional regulator
MRLPEKSFGFLLYDAARLYRRDFERRAKQLGLTRAQWSVLAHLARNEGTNQAAAADVLEIEPITLVRLLDRLEAAGWVERRADPNDRRARLLYLTDKAHPILDQMYGLAMETRDLALTGIAEVDRDTMIEMLIKIRQNLTTREPQVDDADQVTEIATKVPSHV